MKKEIVFLVALLGVAVAVAGSYRKRRRNQRPETADGHRACRKGLRSLKQGKN